MISQINLYQINMLNNHPFCPKALCHLILYFNFPHDSNNKYVNKNNLIVIL